MNWPLVKLESLAAEVPYAFVGGPFGSKLTTRDYVDEGVPVIRGSNMSNGRFMDTNNFVYVSEGKVRDDLFGNLTHPNDLLFTQRGTLGQVTIVPEDGPSDHYVVSQSQMKLTLDEKKADRFYVYYYFTSSQAIQKILNFTSSSGVPHINLTVLRNFEIPLPSLSTQQAISKTLSTYDNLIENNRRRIQLLEQSARLLYKEWFVHLRFPGHEHVKIVDGVPEGWEKTTIRSCTSLLKRGITPKYNNEADGFVINQKCIRNRLVDMSLARKQSKRVPDEKRILPGDILVNSTGKGTLGRVAQYFNSYKNCTVDSHVSIVRPSKPHLRLFMGVYLGLMESLIETLGRGATNQTELSPDSLAELQIVLPNQTLLETFDSFADPIFKQIQTLIELNSRLAKARDLLLPRLMNGEITV